MDLALSPYRGAAVALWFASQALRAAASLSLAWARLLATLAAALGGWPAPRWQEDARRARGEAKEELRRLRRLGGRAGGGAEARVADAAEAADAADAALPHSHPHSHLHSHPRPRPHGEGGDAASDAGGSGSGSDDDGEEAAWQTPPATDAEHADSEPRGPLPSPCVPPTVPYAAWLHRPVLLRADADAAGMRCAAPRAPGGALPMGAPFEFETPLFQGRVLVRAVGLPHADDRAYFKGRKRNLQVVYQGRFKRPLAVGDMFTGHEFSRPLRLPPNFRKIVWLICRFVTAVVPGIVINIGDKRPYARSSFLATVQAMRVDLPGGEPDICEHTIDEDCSRLGGVFAKGKVAAFRRKRLLAASGGGGFTFDTEHVYTFDTYDHVLRLDHLTLKLPAVTIHLADGIDGQPLHFMARDQKSGEYVWSFEVWHEATLKAREERLAGEESD